MLARFRDARATIRVPLRQPLFLRARSTRPPTKIAAVNEVAEKLLATGNWSKGYRSKKKIVGTPVQEFRRVNVVSEGLCGKRLRLHLRSNGKF